MSAASSRDRGQRQQNLVKSSSSKFSRSPTSTRSQEVGRGEREDVDHASHPVHPVVAPSQPVEPTCNAESETNLSYSSCKTTDDHSQWLDLDSEELPKSLPQADATDLDPLASFHGLTTNSEGFPRSSGRHLTRSPTSTVASGAQVFPQSINSPKSSVDVPSQSALWHWNAYHQRQLNLTASLSEATQLRRQCLELREKSIARPISLPAGELQTRRTETESLLAHSTSDTSTLQQLETRLDTLDEKLIHEISEALQAAPRVLNMMQKRLPILLARHQISFRAESNSTSDESNTEFEQHLDPPAAKLLRQQREVDRLEEEILLLRSRRNQQEEDFESRGEQYHQQHFEEIDREIAEAVKNLKISAAELEKSRDTSIETGSDYVRPESPVPPQEAASEPVTSPDDQGGSSKDGSPNREKDSPV